MPGEPGKMRRFRLRNEERKKKRKKWGSHGIITVFVTLMMVPVVAVNGILVDVARLKLYSSQAAMAADSYGDAVLSEFDNLLKQLYGLFSVTQNDDGRQAIIDFAKYAGYSFDPTGGGKALTGFMPYKNTEVELTYEPVEGASLSNYNVLMTQISDFMKYRVVEEVLSSTNILGSLKQLDSTDADMDVMEARTDITDSSKDALAKISEYYEDLKKIAAYPDYMNARRQAFISYREALKQTVGSDEYYYVIYQEKIEEIIERYEKLQESGSEEEEAPSGSGDDEDEPLEELTEEEMELYERFHDFDLDVGDYMDDLSIALAAYSAIANDHDDEPIDFDSVDSVVDDLKKKADELQDVLNELGNQLDLLKSRLSECSEEVREGIEKEIQGLEDILALAEDFERTYELIEPLNADKQKNSDNKAEMESKVPELDEIADAVLDGLYLAASGHAETGDSRIIGPEDTVEWPDAPDLHWYDFQTDTQARRFYQELQQICGTGSGGTGDKDAGDKEIERAQSIQREAEEQMKGDETTTARDIPDALASQLQSSGSDSGEVPGWEEYFSGGLSFEALEKAGSNVLDKFLVATYDFGMFSSRVSGIRPEDEETDEDSSTEEDYVDVSLTGIEMSKDVNYLYGAELEYLFGGHNRSVSNLNNTRNIICGVRLATNFASSYVIREIDTAIDDIAKLASDAVGLVPGIGPAAAVLVRVAVSGALRFAFATIEMVADWNSLKNRERVVFFKRKKEELESIEALEELLHIDISDNDNDHSLGFTYEDYLYILIVLFIDDNTLLSRTSNLITLNVNQAKKKGDTLTELEFKMSDTVTAIKSTCKVKSDFVIVPDNIAQLFYSADTNALVDVLEDNYFGYSVIRGY